MNWSPTFSIRTLFALVGFVALVFALTAWSRALTSIRHESEIVTSNGTPILLNWRYDRWVARRVGFVQPHTRFQGGAGDRPVYAEEIEQEILTLSYDNYAGIAAFSAVFKLRGWYSDKWTNFQIGMTVTGEGIDDGGIECDYDFCKRTQILTLNVSQWINSSRIAKKTTIQFMHDGEAFVPALETRRERNEREQR